MDVNIKPKTLILPGENKEETLCDFKLGKDFLALTPKAQFVKEQTEKLDFVKM